MELFVLNHLSSTSIADLITNAWKTHRTCHFFWKMKIVLKDFKWIKHLLNVCLELKITVKEILFSRYITLQFFLLLAEGTTYKRTQKWGGREAATWELEFVLKKPFKKQTETRKPWKLSWIKRLYMENRKLIPFTIGPFVLVWSLRWLKGNCEVSFFGADNGTLGASAGWHRLQQLSWRHSTDTGLLLDPASHFRKSL